MDNSIEPVGDKLLYEDAHIRVWLLELKGGEASHWHTHKSDYLFVVTVPGEVQTEYESGATEKQRDKRGDTSYREVDARHRLVNTGTSNYQNVIVEFLE